MVASQDDMEGLLHRLDRRFELLENGTFLISVAPDQPPVAARLAPPVLVVQSDVGRVSITDPASQARLYRKLLELNSTDLLHAAYGIEGDSIVLTAALELEALDLNELEAVLADLDMALSEHVPILREMVNPKS